MLERLSKEVVDIAVGAANLIETLPVNVLYKKVITPFAWGVLVFECAFAINTITGGSMASTMKARKNRILYAAMIRECSIALKAAARGGAWKPDLSMVSFTGSVWLLEMILMLPHALYYPLAKLTGFDFPDLPSPGQVDLTNGRTTMVSWHLQEIVEAGARHSTPMLVCKTILSRIKLMEQSMFIPADGITQYSPMCIFILLMFSCIYYS